MARAHGLVHPQAQKVQAQYAPSSSMGQTQFLQQGQNAGELRQTDADTANQILVQTIVDQIIVT